VAPGPAGSDRLRPGSPFEGRIAGGETRRLLLDVPAGSYVHIAVEQIQADVAVRLLDPAGREIAASDGPGGCKEPEVLAWIARDGGDYRLEISPHAADAAAGDYAVRVAELRPARDGDAERAAAERALAEGKQWKAAGGAEDRARALALYEKALGLWHQIGEPRREVETLNQIGPVHRIRGENKAARDSAQQALDLAIAIHDRSGEAEALNNLAVVWSFLGEQGKQEELLERAVPIWEEIGDRHGLATTLFNLGIAQGGQGEIDKALANLERAFAIERDLGDRVEQARILNALALTRADRDGPLVALDLLSQALTLSRAAEDRTVEASALALIGGIHLQLGEPQQALELYESALAINQEQGRLEAQASTLSNLGTTSLYLGDADAALQYYTRALQIHQQTGNPSGEANDLRDIGWVYDRRGQPETALAQYTKAREIRHRPGADPDSSDKAVEAGILQGIGRAHLALRRLAEAREDFQGALAFYREVHSRLGEISALLDLGRTDQALADLPRAEESFRQALDLSQQGRTLMAEAVAQSAMARLDRDRGDLPAAAAAIRESIRIVESIRPKVASQRLRVSFFASRREYYDFQIDLLMRMYEREHDPELRKQALAVSERARARALLDLLAEGRIDLQKGISSELKRSETEIGERISWLQSRLLETLAQPNRQPSGWMESELEEMEKRQVDLQGEIRRDYPQYAAVRDPEPLQLDRIQTLLDGDTALLEYSVGQERSYLFVVTRDGVSGYPLPAEPELEAQVETMRKLLRSPDRLLYGRYVETATRLYRTLVPAEAEQALRRRSHLVISPDGPLLFLNFEALLTGPPPLQRSWKSLPYLLLEKSISYVPSASVLAQLGQAPPETGDTSFLGFAYPVQEEMAAETGSSPTRSAPAPLPEARHEVQAIADLFPGSSSLFLGEQATEENVKHNPLLARARNLHFAVHGFVDEEHPEQSGLILAPGPGEDGRLRVSEIFNLELHADLVVLSACDTGLGRNVAGEGVIGVSRALLYAGAASVVVSLWPVADNSTSDLMVRFYRHLPRMEDKAAALRQSKLEMIREGSFDHPYFWSPFILIGRTR
jgi:CHAT domain-containing protein/tetratricopeptide (TPR) repeat protein